MIVLFQIHHGSYGSARSCIHPSANDFDGLIIGIYYKARCKAVSTNGFDGSKKVTCMDAEFNVKCFP
jgi:hypothetical protein